MNPVSRQHNPQITLAYVPVNGALDLLHISRSKLYELLRTGAIPPVKVGRRTLIAVADIEVFLESARQNSLQPPPEG